MIVNLAKIANILERKATHFLLWRPGKIELIPELFIGTFPEKRNNFEHFKTFPLQQNSEFAELWEIAVTDCGLVEGTVYFYWFKVANTNVYEKITDPIYCTDPISYAVDRRLSPPHVSNLPTESNSLEKWREIEQPASVILYQNGRLIPCDSDGKTVRWSEEDIPDQLAANNQLVIYELPTRWVKTGNDGEKIVGTGTFKDVLSLLRTSVSAPDFPNIKQLKEGHAHLLELGINALELLPPADSADTLNWGYGTANYFAADFDLGKPDDQTVPTASVDLGNIIETCHQKGLRFFTDMVMAFSRDNSYRNINFLDFYIHYGIGDPEQGNRQAFGGDLLKYNYWVQGYHPITGNVERYVSAREYMKLQLLHWMTYYRVDGLRLDSVNNVANHDFLQEFKDLARTVWEKRGGKSDRFLVVGEELSVPLDLIHQKRLDSLWNEKFKQILRRVILGQNSWDESSFEWSVKKLIDCRYLGFTDGSQAINYMTSHDVGGRGNERIYNYLEHHRVYDKERRIKLAFVCLLTAVGIPMILAGDEFADQQDYELMDEHSDHKQIDPVNYERLNDEWRRRVFNYVSRLVKLRTSSPALAVNDTAFLHSDFGDGKRVVVWQRGRGEDILVVVANFSDYMTPHPDSHLAEYVIPNFPATPSGKKWMEVTQNREIPQNWIGREPIYPWEAKVYCLV